MQQKMIAALCIFLSLCAFSDKAAGFNDVVQGNLADGERVSVGGRLYFSGISFYSLISTDKKKDDITCIPLILSDTQRKLAKRIDGQIVRVDAKIIYLSNLNRIFPEKHGAINGRLWSGTPCNSEAALYVEYIRKYK